MMLHAIALKRFCAAVIHMHRQRDRDRPLRVHQPIAIVDINLQIVGDDAELLARHCEHVVIFINTHGRTHKLKRGVTGRRARDWYLRLVLRGVKSNPPRENCTNQPARNMKGWQKSGCRLKSRGVNDWRKARLETLAVHAGHSVDPSTGAVSAPIHLSTTFERDTDGSYSRG